MNFYVAVSQLNVKLGIKILFTRSLENFKLLLTPGREASLEKTIISCENRAFESRRKRKLKREF